MFLNFSHFISHTLTYGNKIAPWHVGKLTPSFWFLARDITTVFMNHQAILSRFVWRGKITFRFFRYQTVFKRYPKLVNFWTPGQKLCLAYWLGTVSSIRNFKKLQKLPDTNPQTCEFLTAPLNDLTKSNRGQNVSKDEPITPHDITNFYLISYQKSKDDGCTLNIPQPIDKNIST